MLHSFTFASPFIRCSGPGRTPGLPGIVLAALICLPLVFAMSGCASHTPHPLLAHSPRQMSDAGLQQYLHDLDRAIAECEGAAAPRPGIVVGAGGSTSGLSGLGVGISQPLGRRCDGTDLRQRRVATLEEMRRRDLRPD